MPIYVTLFKWTDQGRKDIGSLPDRTATATKRLEAAGAKLLGNYVAMGRYDQISIVEAPDDETIAKLALFVCGRGNATTETMRCFSIEEVKKLLG